MAATAGEMSESCGGHDIVVFLFIGVAMVSTRSSTRCDFFGCGTVRSSSVRGT